MNLRDPVNASGAVRIRGSGAVVGVLIAGGFVLFLPFLLRALGVQVSPAWGLGDLAAPLCLLGAIPGFLMARRLVCMD